MTDTLHQEPERDQFKTESPIRAFTDWKVSGGYALGKGFRPSLQHIVPYLEAMERKEGWRVVQVLEAGTQTPSFLFRLEREPTLVELRERYPHLDFVLPEEEPLGETYQADRWTDHGSDIDIPVEYHEEALRFIADKRGMDADRLVKDFMLYFKERNQPNQVSHKTFYRQLQFILPAAKPLELKQLIDQFRVSKQSPVEVTSAPPVSAISDDPINPKHYAGRECADIGERLSANGYQILKYCWRLGKKDDPCHELGKAIWYGESEAALLKAMAHKQGYRHTTPNVTGIKDPAAFLEDRIADQPQFTQNIARMLWAGYSQRQLQAILEAINEHRFHLDCGRGLAI